MGFLDRNENRVENPTELFLAWNSKDAAFTYYDKQSETNKTVKTPFSFLVLKELSTIRGWDDDSQSGIFSNEVTNLANEKIVVKAFKGGVIAEGYYKDIKDRVKAHGGNYTKSIYVMTKGGKLLNVNLKGSAFAEWMEFTKKTKNRLGDEWVTVTGSKTEKKGSVTFQVPIFAFSGVLSDEEFRNANKVGAVLMNYLNAYTSHHKEEEDVKEATSTQTPDDYPETVSEGSFTEDVEPMYESGDLPF